MQPDPNLRPTVDNPGLQVFAPSHPGGPFGMFLPSIPVAVCACRCGAHQVAEGVAEIQAMVTAYTAHQGQCPGRETRPCQHCGQLTRCRSTGMQGWPAHQECYETWTARPVEQRRRSHQVDRIKAREAQRRKAATLRRQLTRDGYTPEVIDLIVSGGWTAEAT